ITLMPAFDGLAMMTEALEASCGARISTLTPCEIRFSHCATCLEASLSVTCTRRSMPAFFASASMVCRSFTQRSSRWVGSESPTLGPAASARAATRTPAHAARSPTDALIRFPPLAFAAIVLPSRNLVPDSTASTSFHRRQARLDAGSRLRVDPPRQLQLHLQPSLALPRVVPVLRRILVQQREHHAAAGTLPRSFDAIARLVLAPAGLEPAATVGLAARLLGGREEAVERTVRIADRVAVLADQGIVFVGEQPLYLRPHLVERLAKPEGVEPRL